MEEEHAKHLRDVRRIEQQTSTYDHNSNNLDSFGTNGNGNGGEMDFESLVKGTSSPVPPASSSVGGLDPWDSGWADSSSTDVLVSLSL